MIGKQAAASGPPARGERGVSTIEYVLLVGMVAVIVIGGVKAIGGTATSTLNSATPQIGGTDTGTSGSGGAASGGATGGGAGAGSDAAPATTPTTTGSTSSSTTTPPSSTSTTLAVSSTTTTMVVVTAPTTTRPPVATAGGVQLAAATTTSFFGYWWGSSQLVVTDDLGAPVSGARVTITFKAYTRNSYGQYSWVTTTQTVTSDTDGSVPLTVGPYKQTSGTSQVTQAVVSVSSVTLPGGLAWDSQASSITINSP